MSMLEERLASQLRGLGGPWEREYRFAAEHVGTGSGLRRRLDAAGLKDWRFDFARPDLLVAVEVEGGAWVMGRHNRAAGFHADLMKYDAALRLGWTVYRCDGRMIREGRAIETIRRMIDASIE